MKKYKIMIAGFAMAMTCAMTGVMARTSGYQTVRVYNDASQFYSDTKTTNTARAGATLSAIGDPDTIIYYAYSGNTLLTSFSVTESKKAAEETRNSGAYYSGISGSYGKSVRMLAKSSGFTIGGYPINTDVDIY